ncbi:speract/scavenger receptor domain-containing protein [Tieghemostelium lacteum]|uniref:Speract/scavenger receptor domain-containing protein n=1 Tax=Tieghemostelium lacteum TaxID=361077 RepID=A0A151ZH05_TIELA|nr:speract/scavenger receptor domain-containing protein [Tieghemostelium lacteum]|eukprot:KYQ93197.1 speract/scavenger receptor domain-containing protein [Tieghemostelium lacteum]
MLTIFFLVLVLLSGNSYGEDCSTAKVMSGQGCYDVWTVGCKKPNWDEKTFKEYNPSLDCSLLSIGQRICCSSGTLPSLIPQPQSNGTCTTYYVKPGDTCASIGSNIGANASQLELFNVKSDSLNGTWGWTGCQNLTAGMSMCLGSGTSPFPAKVDKATCGMISSGNGTDVECPLKACCSKWGFCGVTELFCEQKPSSTMNPGTLGCIKDCNMTYQATSGPPVQFLRIGYYESWSSSKKCLTMSQKDLKSVTSNNQYTHIHFAFANITTEFGIALDQPKEFEWFVTMSGFKKIISFGGWAFSTDPSTTWTFVRMAKEGKPIFIQNLLEFINKYNLDGVDFDWEYPGTEDIPGAANHAGMEDGENYLDFLKDLRAVLPSGKSISIAAPASYWYLKGFPIAEISKVVDYIVYMTYDLHGQWDIGIPSLGGYLKSHVNWTETLQALTMITKAGVPSNKVIMGIGLYGRSFQQVDPSCSGPECKFTGSGVQSLATPGPCTVTPGYIALAEIYTIINSDHSRVRSNQYDSVSDSQILTFDTHDWVSFTTLETNQARTEKAKAMNLGGTVEWAMDLQQFFNDDGVDDDEDLGEIIDASIYDCSQYRLKNLDGIDKVPEFCRIQVMAFTLKIMLKDNIKEYYSMMNNGFNKVFHNDYRPAVFASLSYTLDEEYLDPHCMCDNNRNPCKNLKYFKCNDRACDPSALDPGGPNHIELIDKKGFYEAYADQFKIPVNESYFETKTFEMKCDAGCEFGCTNDYSIKGWPSLVMELGIPNPAESLDHNQMENITRFLENLELSLTLSNESYVDIIKGSMYTIASVQNAIDSMKKVLEIGALARKEKQKRENLKVVDYFFTALTIIAAFFPGGAGALMMTVFGLNAMAMRILITGEVDPADIVYSAIDVLGVTLELVNIGSRFAMVSNKIAPMETKMLKFFEKDMNIMKINKELSLAKMFCK